MTGPGDDGLRRVRACLAEIGYPADAISEKDGCWWWHPSKVPAQVMWRARMVAGFKPICFSCWWRSMDVYRATRDLDAIKADRRRCQTLGLFVENCGVTP